jgi:hypothetical protein
MNLNPKNGHAELGSASHKVKTHETLKQVQGDMTEEIVRNVIRKFSKLNM